MLVTTRARAPYPHRLPTPAGTPACAVERAGGTRSRTVDPWLVLVTTGSKGGAGLVGVALPLPDVASGPDFTTSWLSPRDVRGCARPHVSASVSAPVDLRVLATSRKTDPAFPRKETQYP